VYNLKKHYSKEKIQYYDFLLTFSEEIELVWKGNKERWNISTVIFVVARYLPFVANFVSNYRKLSAKSATVWETLTSSNSNNGI
jgi:hypothetical protein